MPLTVHYIAYASNITLRARVKPTTLTTIKFQANTNNVVTGITGFLFLKNKKFFQYFEGTKQSCDNLLQTLKQDTRHHNLTILSQGTTPQRQFGHWAMYCLKSKEISKEINQRLSSFDVFNWKDNDIQEVLELMKKQHQGNLEYSVENDNLDTLYMDVTQRHKVFFVIQIGILLASIGIIASILLNLH